MVLPRPLNQTFGVEMEFVVRVRPCDYLDVDCADKTSFDEPVHQDICKAMRNAGFIVNPYDYRLAKEYGNWIVAPDSTIDAFASSNLAGATRPEDFAYVGVEVKSPPLEVGPDALAAVREVVALLHKEFDIVGNNRSCGLHVHVGNGVGKGFPLRTVQNLATFIWVFYQQIDCLHPVDRTLENYWALSPHLSVQHLSPLARVHVIEKCASIEAVVGMVNNVGRCYAYNFTNLDSGPNGTHTVEFRQHEGTMDVVAIISWIEFTTALVKWCHEVPQDRLLELITSYAASTVGGKNGVAGLNILGICEIIGKPDLCRFYGKRLFAHEYDPPMSCLQTIEEIAKEEEGEKKRAANSEACDGSDGPFGAEYIPRPFDPNEDYAKTEEGRHVVW
ncbi:MAG: hypothetical protein M1827_005275 [Pycnora praestabilis]|nr:MAG: hypothetical protein M1827_005275 [Pycnora praestabilis]